MLEQTNKGLLLSIKVTPQAKKNEVLLSKDGFLHIKTTAAPENNKANEAIIDNLSKFLDLPKSSLQVHKGQTSRKKKILIQNASFESIQERINNLC